MKVEWAHYQDLLVATNGTSDYTPVVRVEALRAAIKQLHDGYTGDCSAYRWALDDLLAALPKEV